VNTSREFDAEFMAAGADAFFDPRAIESSVDAGLVLPRPRSPYTVISIGADFGFRSDSSALVVVERDADVYTVADVVELRPEKDKPLVPSAVVTDFAKVAARYSVTSIVADAHYRESIAEHLRKQELWLQAAPEGANGKAETHQTARVLLHGNRVRLPQHERLLRQLREVVSRPTVGGAVTISSPRWRGGGHGDLVSALVLALHDASRRLVPEKPNALSSEERAQREAERLKEETRLSVVRQNRKASRRWHASRGIS
jgi:hypothetical protein